MGNKSKMCPYYLTRQFLGSADVIVYNYSYMLDPKISNHVSKEFSKDCVVVFDECHNMDNVCIESFSVNVTRKSLDKAKSNLKRLEDLVKETKVKDTRKL